MFVDASAIIAILASEPDGETLAATLDQSGSANRITSVIAVWEAAVGLYRKKRVPMAEAEARVHEFLAEAGVEMIAVSADELTVALQAFDRFGRHRYADSDRNRALSLADCFHYACAKTHGTSILHKDPGFDLTDVANAVRT